MQYRRLGRSGLKVSRIALGCMMFGDAGRGYPDFTLSEDDSRPLLRAAIEAEIGENGIAVAQHVVRAGPDRLDRARQIAAHRDRQRVLLQPIELARPHLAVDRVDAGRAHADQHLVVERLRDRHLLQRQDLSVSEPRQADGGHHGRQRHRRDS